MYTYGYSLCNKSPLPTPGGGGRALFAASRIGSVSTPYQRSEGNPTLVAGRKGHFLSLNGYDEGRAHIVVVAIFAATPLPFTTPRARRERASALCVSLSSGTFLPLPPPFHPVLPISLPNLALSTYRMLCHTHTAGRYTGYFAKWLNALPDYGVEDGVSGARCRCRPNYDILWNRRIPP